jgi:hypothetical protein
MELEALITIKALSEIWWLKAQGVRRKELSVV